MKSPILYIAESLCETVADSLYKAIADVNATGKQIRCAKLKNVPGCDPYYWCRDYMPVLVSEDGTYARFKFNPDYLRNSKTYCKCVIPQEEVCKGLNFKQSLDLGITFDGGNYVRCGNKVVMTDKIFTENPEENAAKLLKKLEETLQAEIVLLPWDMKEFCGHSDGMVTYLGNGKVLLNGCWEKKAKSFHERLLTILKGSFGADNVEVLRLEGVESRHTWCYLNYLQFGDVIFLPRLHAETEAERAAAKADKADAFSLSEDAQKCDTVALDVFEKFFDGYKIKQVYAWPLVRRGGALHCVTWELVEQD